MLKYNGFLIILNELIDQGRRNKGSTRGSLDRVSIYESIRYLRARKKLGLRRRKTS